MKTAEQGERAPFTGRAAYSISQIYYYAAAVVGVGFVIGGGISTLIELRHLILPERTTVFGSDTTRGSVHGILVGLAFLIPGLVVALWHLREARRREGRFVKGAFWGKALYFHLVAFISVVTLMGGAAATLTAVADVILPPCVPQFSIEPGSTYQPTTSTCEARGEAARHIADGIIVMIVSGGVFSWHLWEARRKEPEQQVPARAAAGPPPLPPQPAAG